MSQTPEERREIARKSLLQTIIKYNIGSEFTREGFERAVEIILHKRPQREGDKNKTARRRSQTRKGT